MPTFYVEFFKMSTNLRRKIKKIFNFSTLKFFFASGGQGLFLLIPSKGKPKALTFNPVLL